PAALTVTVPPLPEPKVDELTRAPARRASEPVANVMFPASPPWVVALVSAKIPAIVCAGIELSIPVPPDTVTMTVPPLPGAAGGHGVNREVAAVASGAGAGGDHRAVE